jgi:iron complex outermembrane receptor protein
VSRPRQRRARASLVRRAAALICLCPASWVAAQAPATEEDRLDAELGDGLTVTIATGHRQPLRRAPAVATVIRSEDIAALGAADLDHLLASVPGLHVSRSQQAYAPLYVVRGIVSEFNPQTLMLLNGVPLTTLFVGNRGNLWAGLPVENISRVEVIRGPGSALYGADAYSGVINIVTRSAEELAGLEVGARLGSFASRDAWLQAGGGWGPVQLAGYLRLGRTEGPRLPVRADAQTALDGLFGTRASLAPAASSNGADAVDASVDAGLGGWRLRASYKLRDHIGTGLGVASALDPVGQGRSERLLADLSRPDIVLGPHWKLGLNASLMRYVQTFPVPLQLFPPGAFGGTFPNGMIGAPETWERQLRLGLVGVYSGWDAHLWRIGAGHDDLNLYRTRELKNFSVLQSGPFVGLPVPTPGAAVQVFPVEQSFLAPHRRRVDYLYLQDEWNFRRDWTLTAGLRHDRYSDSGGTTNPRLALVWDTSLNLTTKLLFGRAFRAPSFTEQHSINNPVIRGNPALKPETMHTTEAAMAWQARADLLVKLSAYRYRMRDVIRTTQSGDGSAEFNNVGRQNGRGLEAEFYWQADRRWSISGHYALQRSTDDATGQDAGGAPRQRLWARADWTAAGGWALNGQLGHVGERRRAPGDARDPLAGHTSVDLALRSPQRRRGWELAAGVRNLFDARMREPSLAPGTSLPEDIPLPGRSVWLQWIYRP